MRSALAIGLLFFLSAPASAVSELLLYGSGRVGLQGSDHGGDTIAFRNLQSRLGARAFVSAPGAGATTGALLHLELGSERAGVSARGRLAFAGVTGPAGRLTYGKQWSAFYTVVGSRMDAATDRSGFGYIGSERVSDALQYARGFGELYLQLDAIRDDAVGTGFNRIQVGVDRDGGAWRYGAAVDLDEGSSTALASPRLRAPDPSRPGAVSFCSVAGVDCAGVTVGWAASPYGADLGLVHARSNGDSLTSAALTLSYRPSPIEYYAELTAVNAARTDQKTLAIGIRYRYGRHMSSFSEFSLADFDGADDATDHTLVIGVRLDFEKYF